jgi:hypothetical protein
MLQAIHRGEPAEIVSRRSDRSEPLARDGLRVAEDVDQFGVPGSERASPSLLTWVSSRGRKFYPPQPIWADLRRQKPAVKRVSDLANLGF